MSLLTTNSTCVSKLEHIQHNIYEKTQKRKRIPNPRQACRWKSSALMGQAMRKGAGMRAIVAHHAVCRSTVSKDPLNGAWSVERSLRGLRQKRLLADTCQQSPKRISRTSGERAERVLELDVEAQRATDFTSGDLCNKGLIMHPDTTIAIVHREMIK